jgi:hypothetical protein
MLSAYSPPSFPSSGCSAEDEELKVTINSLANFDTKVNHQPCCHNIEAGAFIFYPTADFRGAFQ